MCVLIAPEVLMPITIIFFCDTMCQKLHKIFLTYIGYYSIKYLSKGVDPFFNNMKYINAIKNHQPVF